MKDGVQGREEEDAAKAAPQGRRERGEEVGQANRTGAGIEARPTEEEQKVGYADVLGVAQCTHCKKNVLVEDSNFIKAVMLGATIKFTHEDCGTLNVLKPKRGRMAMGQHSRGQVNKGPNRHQRRAAAKRTKSGLIVPR